MDAGQMDGEIKTRHYIECLTDYNKKYNIYIYFLHEKCIF